MLQQKVVMQIFTHIFIQISSCVTCKTGFHTELKQMQWGEIWISATRASVERLDFPHTCFSIACTRRGNTVIKLHQKFSLGSRRAQRTILKCIWQFRYWARSYFDKACEQKCGWYWADHYHSGDTLEHTNTWATCQERCRHCRQLLLFLVCFGWKCAPAED